MHWCIWYFKRQNTPLLYALKEHTHLWRDVYQKAGFNRSYTFQTPHPARDPSEAQQTLTEFPATEAPPELLSQREGYVHCRALPTRTPPVPPAGLTSLMSRSSGSPARSSPTGTALPPTCAQR